MESLPQKVDNNTQFWSHQLKTEEEDKGRKEEEEEEKARGIAGVINRNITNKTKNVMVPLFKSMVRPVTAGI